MWFYPVQFFTILTASALSFSLFIQLCQLIPAVWIRVVLALVFIGLGIGAWGYWYAQTERGKHCEVALLAVAIGFLVGLSL